MPQMNTRLSIKLGRPGQWVPPKPISFSCRPHTPLHIGVWYDHDRTIYLCRIIGGLLRCCHILGSPKGQATSLSLVIVGLFEIVTHTYVDIVMEPFEDEWGQSFSPFFFFFFLIIIEINPKNLRFFLQFCSYLTWSFYTFVSLDYIDMCFHFFNHIKWLIRVCL